MVKTAVEKDRQKYLSVKLKHITIYVCVCVYIYIYIYIYNLQFTKVC